MKLDWSSLISADILVALALCCAVMDGLPVEDLIGGGNVAVNSSVGLVRNKRQMEREGSYGCELFMIGQI